MKTTQILFLGISIVLFHSRGNAQIFAAGQVNNSYIYSAMTENTAERLFTGISAEIGAEGMSSAIILKSGLYIPKKYEFLSVVEDPYGYYYETEIDQRIMIYELGLYGLYYILGQQGNLVRFYTNSGIEMVWAIAHDEYQVYDELISEKFTNRQLRIGVGLGVEVELGENLYLINDFLFKYPFTDMDSGGIMYIDAASDFTFNYNVGVKIYLN